MPRNMTTVLLNSRNVEIPKEVLEESGLQLGDHLEIFVEEDGEIILRKKPSEEDGSWVEVLLQCPGPLEIPERQKDYKAPIEF